MLVDYLTKKLHSQALDTMKKMSKCDVDWEIIMKIEQSLPTNFFRRTKSCLVVICYKFYLMGLNKR